MRLSEAEARLRAAGIENARREARELFFRIGGYSMPELLTENPKSENGELILAVERRCKREPLQYIIGEVGFFRESYLVNESCLIPREDTELLVGYAVDNIPEGESFLDLCTGSGCIGISTLKNTKNTRACLSDISEATLDLAKKNAKRCGVSERADFMLCDVLSELPAGEYFAILSNPPYVRAAVYERLDREIFFEPKIAFVGGDDGLIFYKSIIEKAPPHLKRGGFIALEIGYDQGRDIEKIAKDGGFCCEIHRDLSGNERLAVLRRLAV